MQIAMQSPTASDALLDAFDQLPVITEAVKRFLWSWAGLSDAGRAALTSWPEYDHAFDAAVHLKHVLQAPLMTGPPHHRVLSRGAPGSHPLDDTVSDSGSCSG